MVLADRLQWEMRWHLATGWKLGPTKARLMQRVLLALVSRNGVGRGRVIASLRRLLREMPLRVWFLILLAMMVWLQKSPLL